MMKEQEQTTTLPYNNIKVIKYVMPKCIVTWNFDAGASLSDQLGVARALEEIFNLVRHYHDQNKEEEEEEEGTEVGTEEGTEVETGNYFFSAILRECAYS